MTTDDAESPCAHAVVVSHDDGVTLVRLSGEVDAACRDALTQAGEAVLAQDADVVVDVAAVSFLDSVGVSFLVRLATHSREHGRTVVLRQVPPAVWEVLALVGAADLFDVQG